MKRNNQIIKSLNAIDQFSEKISFSASQFKPKIHTNFKEKSVAPIDETDSKNQEENIKLANLNSNSTIKNEYSLNFRNQN